MKVFLLCLLIAIGLIVLAAIPREEMGNLSTENCIAQITTQAGATDTYFKTFICQYISSTAEDCGYYQIKNGVCLARFDYTKTITIR